jgi:hypothetical protein
MCQSAPEMGFECPAAKASSDYSRIEEKMHVLTRPSHAQTCVSSAQVGVWSLLELQRVTQPLPRQAAAVVQVADLERRMRAK